LLFIFQSSFDFKKIIAIMTLRKKMIRINQTLPEKFSSGFD